MQHKIEITEHTNNIVKLRRDFVHSIKYKSSIHAMWTFGAVASMVRKDDEEFKMYSFTNKELSNIIGRRVRREDFDKLHDELRSLAYYKVEDNIKTSYPVFDVISHKLDGSMISLSFSRHMKPYLLEFQDNFLQHGLGNILALKTPYLIRMYQVCKDKLDCQFIEKDVVTFNIEVQYIRDTLMTPKSYKYSHIKQLILNKAVKQFENTDIAISYK